MARARTRHTAELPVDIPDDALEADSDIPLSDSEAQDMVAAARFAGQGPLADLIPVFIDVETYINGAEGITLRSQTLRQYLAASHLTAIAVGIGDDPIELFYPADEEGLPDGVNRIDDRLVAALKQLAADPRYVFVAHNAAFDMRVLRIMLGIPHPENVWCTLEGSMGAWPELPGGFGLSNVSKKLQLPKNLRKLHIDLDELTRLQHKAATAKRPLKLSDLRETVAEWVKEIAEIGKLVARGLWDGVTITVDLCHRLLGIYNLRDVEAMRAVYWRQLTRIGAPEQQVGLLTHRQRKNYFHVNQKRLEELIIQLDKNAEYAEKLAGEYLTEDQKSDIFNRGEDGKGPLRSLRYGRLKNVVNTSLASEEFTTVSAKKVSPIQLARNPTVRAVLEQTSRVGKMLSHRRRSAVFNGVDIVDLELGAWRAHTGRFSSPSVGKGLNIHNCPKHDKAIAEPVRKMFRFPDELCLVRGDLANVEYRIEGLITGCRTVQTMFDTSLGGNIYNDPYMLAWKAMTGATIKDKKDPIRQVSKSAVLGLGYCMSAAGYAKVLLTALADPRSGVTEDLLRETIMNSGWTRPGEGQVEAIIEKLGCSVVVALAAFHIHRVFNEAHPEFRMTAYWLVDVVKAVASCGTGKIGRDAARAAIEMAYAKTTAPDRSLINLFIDDDPLPRYPSIRAACGYWGPTVCWREPYMRRNPFDPEDRGPRLTIRKSAGRVGTFKSFSPQLAIENLAQAAARNALCMGLLKLESRGFKDVIHVHDEIMIICKRDPDTVLAAREALLWAFGPQHDMPYGWSILVKPEEVTVTQSLYEDEDDIAEFVTRKDENKQLILGADGKPAKFPGPDRWGRIRRKEPGCLENLP